MTTGAETTTAYLSNTIVQRDRALVRLDVQKFGGDFPGPDEFIARVNQKFAAAGL